MAPNSTAALVLLAAIIAGLAPPLQAQIDASIVGTFSTLVDQLCPGDDAMKSCVGQLVASGDATNPTDCCGALLKVVTSGEDTGCACRFWAAAFNMLGVDVGQRCQTASNGGVPGGPSKLMEFCIEALGN
ncbi:hypothetical protein SETIT_8G223500v2 [Setaria italica]|uniref:Uncharacterized protein n=1 Tax=Setaria italica TaxID=4555 RepID=A0A368SAF6_SETIT|nr:hypothetical protein SETIT_8G223500v2 [Setaria italica]